ncbi:MAG: alkyl hydroperoxide reductase [Bacteroidetes bacterium MedPE-SWsnd-G1]|nr:MAG: alkyl hydroperoxide reductase [Bacteroidetes bacterium MedPE-SWsnd-G1]
MKNYKFIISTIFLTALFHSCTTNSTVKELKQGNWRGEITIQQKQLPFNFNVSKSNDDYKIVLHDGDNPIEIDEIEVRNDSVFFTMHIFDIDVKAKILENTIEGTYTKNYAEDYILAFKATYNKESRLDNAKAETDFNGKWSFKFDEDPAEKKKIAVFKTEDGILKGTLLTPTGDYRFLEGTSDDGAFKLYAFDGNHMYIFEGKLTDNETLTGEYWSGKTAYKTFTATRDENATLPDASTLTYLKDGYDKIEFSFPGLNGTQVTLEDEKYQDKVVILQLLGSWCPNCMDETKFLTKWYDQNKDRGVEIIGLAYELKDDFEYAKGRVSKMKKRLNVNYDFVIAGTSDVGNASKSLPMLNKVMSFPTSIIIDKNGKVRTIHTGFNGPATGDYYDEYVLEFNHLLDELLSE